MSFVRFFLFFLIAFKLYGYESPKVKNGVIDLTYWKGETINLNGEWKFYWKKFLGPNFINGKHTGKMVKVPGPWGKENSRLGYGTFVLKIRGLKKGMGLRINENFSATKIFAVYPDQFSFIYGVGRLGKTAKEEIPKFSFHVAPIHRSGSFYLMIHISNFNYRSGNLAELRIGNYKKLKRTLFYKNYLDYLMMGILLIMGIYHLGLYSQRKENLDTLFFGLLCILLLVRIGVIGYHFVWFYNKLDLKIFKLMTILNYLLTIVIPVVGLSFVAYLFENKFLIRIQRPIYWIWSILLIPFIFLPTNLFTQNLLKSVNQGSAVFIFLLLIFQSIIMVLKRVRYSKLFVISIGLTFFGLIYDIMTTFDLVPPGEIIIFTFIFFIFTQSYILSLKFAAAFSTAERLSNHLQEEVDIKTKVLKEEKEKAINSEKETSELLNNMKQAVFCIDGDGVISPPVSLFSKNIFNENIENKSIYDTLFKDVDRNSSTYSKVLMVFAIVFESDDIQWYAMKEELPSKVEFGNRVLKVAYGPIMNEGVVTKFMLVVEDVTKINDLEKRVKEEEERSAFKIKRLQEIVKNTKKEAKVFIRDTLIILKNAKEAVENHDFDQLFRAIHTLKGNARIYFLSCLSEELHLIETNLIKNKNLSSIEKEFKNQVNIYIDLIKDIFGKDVDETVLFDSDFVEIEKGKFFSTINNIKTFLNKRDSSGALLELTKLGSEDLLEILNVLHRTVKKMSFSLKKEVSLKILGTSVYLSLEKSTMIKDSLLHLIQNSVDHGIEKEGVILIEVTGRDSYIDIILSDNGKGIDPEKVLSKAIQKGLVSQNEAEKLTQQKILELIMRAGFSTKEVATEYSGRGVGLDVVKVNIEKLDGNLAIASKLGHGTTFTISIPIS
ncbi:ATP-binding protein [Bacteriovoracales bacterium]|nr:ATP-binding protein [Bacteriovoracales bacterium]